MAKIASTEELGVAADALVQVLGGRGYLESHPAARIFRDARMLRIGEGPTEALRMHAGALYSADAPSLLAFLSETLAAPVAARDLEVACRDLEHVADTSERHDATGALAVLATLRAAARDESANHYARVFERARLEIHERSRVPSSPSTALLDVIGSYDEAIGSLSATVSPSSRCADPYLSDEPFSSSDEPAIEGDECARIEAWECGAPPPQPEGSVCRLVEGVVSRVPDQIAIFADSETLTYGELWRRAQQLAGVLQARGVTPGALVPVCLWRTPRLIEAALGVLLARGRVCSTRSRKPPRTAPALAQQARAPCASLRRRR